MSGAVALLALVLAQASARPLAISAAGDLQIDDALPASALRATAELLGGDLRFANLETPITGRGSASGLSPADRSRGEPIRFAARPAAAEGLERVVDVLSIANNHALDQGSAGASETRAWLSEHHLAAASDDLPLVTERGGQHVTWLARAWEGLPTSAQAQELEAQVAAAHADGPVIVSLHWGFAQSLLPTPEQRAIAHALVEAGASAVLGHGPHVAQGVERHQRSVIAYSLGNFAFACRCTEGEDAIVLHFVLEPDGAVTEIRAVPVDAGLRRAPRRSNDPTLADQIASLSRALGADARVERGDVLLR